MYQHRLHSSGCLVAVGSVFVFLSVAPVVRAQVRTVTPATLGDSEACPQTASQPPVTVTVQQDLGGGNAGDAVTVIEEVHSRNVDAGSISAPGAVVEPLTRPARPVGDFADSLAVGEGDSTGCIGQAGEWSATEDAGAYTLADS